MYKLYIFGCIQIFFICELLKSLESPDVRYENCVRIVRYAFDTLDDSKRACSALHYHETFDQFILNLFCMIGVISFLIQDTQCITTNISYWVVCASSVIVYIYSQSLSLFQFSIDSHSIGSFTPERVILITLTSCIIVALLVRQIALRRVTYRLLVIPTGLYLLSLVLRTSFGGVCTIHLHHAIVAGFLSLFVTQTPSLHAICIGIVIQAINYHGGQTLMLFESNGLEAPSTSFMLFVNTCWLGSMLLITFIVLGMKHFNIL